MNINEIKNFLSQLPLPAAHFDPSGEVVHLNSAFTKLLGYTKADIPTVESHWLLFFPDDAYREKVQKDWTTMLEESAKSGAPIQPMLLDIVAKNGEVKKLEVHSLQMGTLAITMWIDLTEKLKAKEYAEQANKAKSEFLSSMSHELRTPLNAILGFSEILQLDEKDEEKRKYIQEIIGGGNHLLELINQILDLAKIESGHVDLSIKEHSLNKIINFSLSMIKPLADKNDIQIENKTSSLPDKNISIDEMRFKQVLLNILSNAIKYNSESGTVTIDYSSNDNNMLSLSISDTGKGFTSEQLTHLFEPFERFGAENSHIEGTGLGLVIAKDLIELMGGTITVESEIGKGSRFMIYIPLS